MILDAFGFGVSYEPLADARLLAPLLEVFPSGTAAELRVIETTDALALEGASPVLFHGWIQVARRGESWLVWDALEHAASAIVEGDTVRVSVRDARGVYARGVGEAALLVALRLRGLYELHASAVVAAGATLLLVGPSGSGKTTAALSLLARGARGLGDDKVLFGRGRLWAFPRAFHVAPRTERAFFPSGSNVAPDPGNQKRAMNVLDRTTLMPSAAPPALIALVGLAAGPTRVEPVAAEEALGALMESSAGAFVDGMPGREANLTALTEVVAGARSVRLSLGEDALADPGLAARVVLDALSGPL